MRYEKYNNHPVEPIVELDIEAVEDFYPLIKDVYSRNDLNDINHYYQNGEFYVLLGDDDQIIGTCAYLINDTTTVELKRLRIKKVLRGKGLGKKLILFIEDKIKEAGFKTIILNTSIMRESTLKFYEKMGFEVTGKKPYGGIELVYFKKEL